MAWSGFGQTNLVWKQAGVQESSGPVSGRMQPARYQVPTFTLGSVLPQTARIILMQNQPGSDLILADCIRFGPNGSGPEVNASIIRPASGQCFQADPDRMRIGSGMFTGLIKPLEVWLYLALQPFCPIKLEDMLGKLTERNDPVEPRLREVHGELNRTRNRLRQVELEAQQHKVQLSLLEVVLEWGGRNAVE